jgi:hypothetical protein
MYCGPVNYQRPFPQFIVQALACLVDQTTCGYGSLPCVQRRDERKTGILVEPMGFPWERELESELDGNGNNPTGEGGNGDRTVLVKR